MSEVEERLRVVAAARTWIGTPFHLNAAIKGPKGGIDCLRLVWKSFIEAGVITDPGVDPWPHYELQWSMHSSDETLASYVLQYAREVDRVTPLPADIALVKRSEDLCFAHAGLVTGWPKVIHVMDRERGAAEQDVRAFRRWHPMYRFFSVWKPTA